MSYKKLIPCIFIDEGKAVKWFDNREVLSENVVSLAKYYSDHGADELFVFDLSSSDEEHEEAIAIMKKISRAIRIPMVAGDMSSGRKISRKSCMRVRNGQY